MMFPLHPLATKTMPFNNSTLELIRQSLLSSRARAREDLTLVVSLAGGDVSNSLVRAQQLRVDLLDAAFRDVMKAIESLRHDEDR